MTARPMNGQRLEDAYYWIARGFPVLPIVPGKEKKPATEHGFYDATWDLSVASSWFKNDRYNIGIRIPRDFIVIDPDGDEGIAALDRLQNEHAQLPKTLTQKTGRGFHYLFKVREPVRKCNIAPCINPIGSGRGYVVAARSIHHSGQFIPLLTTSQSQKRLNGSISLQSCRP